MKYSKLDEVRFWSNVNVGLKDSCWYWKRSKHNFGYGWFRINKKSYSSHRLALIFWNGSEKKDLNVLHNCNNPSCCNPNHLRWGTQYNNVQDSIKAGTKSDPPINNSLPPVFHGSEHPISKLTEKDVIKIRKERSTGVKIKDLAEKYFVSNSCISGIINYKSWKHI